MKKNKRSILIVGYGQDGKILHEKSKKKGIEVFIIGKKNTLKSHKAKISTINIADKYAVFNYLKYKKNLDIYFFATHNISTTQKENKVIFKKNIQSNVLGLGNFLEFMSISKKKGLKLFYACSSHIFENSKKYPQNENSFKFFKTNYALTKLLGLKLCEYYRYERDVYCSVGILYTHVSKYTKQNFLIKELAKKILNAKKNGSKFINVYNKNSKIDIMTAKEAVVAMEKVMSLKHPDTFIISSGKLTSLKDIFLSILKFYKIKRKIFLKSSIKKTNKNFYLFGDNKKLQSKIKWKPKINLKDLINEVLK